MAPEVKLHGTGSAMDGVAAAADRRDEPLIEIELARVAAFTKVLQSGGSILSMFAEAVRSHPGKPFVLSGDEVHTYAQVDSMANRVANLFHGRGFHKGDTVALLMYNGPAFVWTFLGLARLGVKMALLNTNLRGQGLMHCFRVAGARGIIVGQGQPLLDATLELQPELQAEGASIWLQGPAPPPAGMSALDGPVRRESDQPLPVKVTILPTDTLCYIYTSGTTGLPKAAIIPHAKFVAISSTIMHYAGVYPDDVFYITLPLYHTSGLALGLGTAITKGATLALRSKFSVRHFWDDCRRYKATVILYIGELLRYLCTAPLRPDDRDHSVRLAFGNGLRPDIWQQFQDRFGIPRIGEFYGMTEGTMGLTNIHNKVGAVGVASPLYRKHKNFTLIECDIDTGEPIRGKDGKCTEVKLGQTGLLVNRLSPATPYAGYLGKRELTEKKILRDVFEKGDMYFNTGDLMMIDKEFFIYFVDRVGDTFRWKGENVATTEVAQVLSKMEGVQEVNVYGVKVPGQDGRAGMASILPNPGKKPDFPRWYRYIQAKLPPYARPLFLRLSKEIQVTGTFKHQKAVLVKEGFDPGKVGDPLFVVDNGRKSYVPLDQTAYRRIVVGQARL
ncbi:PREDICTED: very long-chain acyl-CoA synthetase-like [Branchiostoma belcheri]|uniref:Very long-chain fatty acid transport protein n=1 Tax=Branchiostoma belcheri TaxID=7741 RepID=A0A6P4XZR3_BRABE|nr:PREDICTED: very long-chain acyl-CoA synthetase-like [Branchiostoma belcheri]